MAFLTNAGGPFSTLEAQYTSQGGGTPQTGTAMPAAPAYGGFKSGGFLNPPRTQYTSTSDAQRIPSAPFKVLAAMDSERRVDKYSQGEILFGAHAFGTRGSNGVQRILSLWDLNLSLRRSHEHWVNLFENCNSAEDAKRVMMSCLAQEQYRYKAESTSNKYKSDSDFLELLELNNTARMDTFLREYPFIGVTIDPRGTEVSRANLLADTSGVKVFVCDAEGRVKMPNIFRAVMPGTEVGLLVTKFNNPHVLGNDVNMSWRDILNNLKPFQVWPVSNYNTRFPSAGCYAGESRRTNGAAFPLPVSAGEYKWDERDPQKIQAMYCEYSMALVQGDGHAPAVIYPSMDFRPAYYFSIGVVEQAVAKVPSVADVTDAVSPTTTDMYSINSAWTRLMTNAPITVHARSPSFDMLRCAEDL